MPNFRIRDFVGLRPRSFLDKDERDGVAAAHLVASGPVDMSYDQTMPALMHALTIHFPGACRTVLDVGGKRLLEGAPPPWTVTFAPAGERVQAEVSQAIDLLQLYVSVPWLDALTRCVFTRDGQARPAPLRPFQVCDHTLYIIGQAMLLVLDDDQTQARRLQFDGLATAFLTRLLARHLSEKTEDHTGLTALRQNDLRLVLQTIDNQLGSPLPLTRLANIVGLSPFHFSRSFKQATGMPPGRFVQKRRMEHARGLLCEGTQPIAEVAAAVGYDDPSHFARLFQRQFGSAPRDFRHMSKVKFRPHQGR